MSEEPWYSQPGWPQTEWAAPPSADQLLAEGTLYHMVCPVLELRTPGMGRGWLQVAGACGVKNMEEDSG